MELDRIYNGDCLEGMRALPDGCVDLIITDPPYEFISSDSNYGGRGAFGSVGREYHGELDKAGLVGGFQREEVMRECIRISRKVNIYIWCSKAQIRWYLDFFGEYNMELLCWHKTNPIPTVYNKYLSDTEYLLFFREAGAYLGGSVETKKKWWLQNINASDKARWGHPTIKPLNIIRTLIVNSSREGEVVCDPFMGSGTTAVACLKENRHYIGWEIDSTYYDIAQKRIGVESSQMEIF